MRLHARRNEVTCGGCSGFEGRTRREHKKDGFVVKVAEDEYGIAGKRKTVGSTAWYQLNHATTRHGVVRFHVATWFGVCSYRKLKVTAKVKKAVCPLCPHDLEKLRYLGGKAGILVCYGFDRNSCDRSDFYADLFEDGREVWVVEVREGYRDNG